MTDLACNICNASDFTDRGERSNALCRGCGADERTRLLWLHLQRHDRLRPGRRVLHLAPEPALAPRLHALLGDGYEPADIDPARYPHAPGIRKLDLVTDAATLPSGHYDLVLHSHVMEHLLCNVWAVLFHLHRALKPDGLHVCCIPIMRGHPYAEDLGPLTDGEATARFGQHDHVRIFGQQGIDRTLGMLFRLPQRYDLTRLFDPAVLRRHAIPERAWIGWSPQSVLALAPEDMLLRA